MNAIGKSERVHQTGHEAGFPRQPDSIPGSAGHHPGIENLTSRPAARRSQISSVSMLPLISPQVLDLIIPAAPRNTHARSR